jgi:class 3 adenylate cyclase/pimeloyl-ACP methyl ester carboxylesterase
MIPATRWARTIDGASIAYQDFGEGSLPLVVIHGWISHLEVCWEEPRFARFMERLGRGFRVLHFDKRGTGMSDRLTQVPELEKRVDDVRAVMDSANVERAALFGWATGGAPLAYFFAATHPERTLAVCTDPEILDKQTSDYRWGWGGDAQQHERLVAGLIETWGDPSQTERFVEAGFGTTERDGPISDPAFRSWCAKFARFSATPTSYEAFDRMWYDTDVRAILPLVQAPAVILYKEGAVGIGDRSNAEYVATLVPGARIIQVPGYAAVVWIEEPEPFVSALEAFLSSVQRDEADFDRVLATVLFTDIVASTDTAASIGDHAWKELLERHHQAVRAILRRYRGTELDTAGDGFYASFDGPARAVRCGQAIAESTQRLGLQIRAGVHTGEVELIDGKPGGMAVNIGARIASRARADEVVVSQTVKDLVVGSGLSFQERGEHTLKGVPGTWRLYAANGA